MKTKQFILFFLFLSLFYCSVLFAQTKQINVAILVWRGETNAEQGFRDGLKELGYTANFTVFNADQKKEEMGRILRMEIMKNPKRFDYVYTFGTTLSKAARLLMQDQIPQIFNIVTEPVKAEVVKSIESTGGNISGVSSYVPLKLQISTALKVKKFKKLGVIFNSREENTEIILDELQSIAKQSGFELVKLRAAPGDEGVKQLEDHLQNIKNKSVEIDAVYLPMDSFLVSNAKMIGEALVSAKIFSVGSVESFITNGVLIGVIPDYYELGKISAGILDRHHKGEKLEAVPVQFTEHPILMINKSTQLSLGITLPEAMMKNSVMVE